MNDKVFIDTNIMIYGYDLDAGRKHDCASRLLKQLWDTKTGVMSTQVLQDFYVNITRKINQPLSPARARGIISCYNAWQLEVNGIKTILQACCSSISIMKRIVLEKRHLYII